MNRIKNQGKLPAFKGRKNKITMYFRQNDISGGFLCFVLKVVDKGIYHCLEAIGLFRLHSFLYIKYCKTSKSKDFLIAGMGKMVFSVLYNFFFFKTIKF